MEFEPIYCAEQIVVPSGLDEVLKQFVKEAIRAKPWNLPNFAAEYFACQAVAHRELHEVHPPARQQLRAVYECLRSTPVAPWSDIEAACRSAGIGAAAVAAAVRGGSINMAYEVSMYEMLLLLLAMGCDSLGALLRGVFDVFGQDGGTGVAGIPSEPRLDVPVLLQVLGFLAARDPGVTPAMREGVARALDGHISVTLRGLAGVPALASMLAKS